MSKLLNDLFDDLPIEERQTLLLSLDLGNEYRSHIRIDNEDRFLAVNSFPPKETVIEQEGLWTYARQP